MHEAAATPAWVLLAYLISGVCFILALRGLSSPESSRRGNLTGMVGMAIAVVTTLIVHAPRVAGTAPDEYFHNLNIDWNIANRPPETFAAFKSSRSTAL